MKNTILKILALLPVGAILLLQCQALADVKKKPAGQAIFDKSCWSCHADKDSNLIDPGKTISNSKKISSERAFEQFLAAPHGKMPDWKTIVRNKRELHDLYNYVVSIKAHGTASAATR